MNERCVGVNLSAANIALLLLFGSACFHCCAQYFYFHYRLVFGTLFPAYSSYKAIQYKDVKQYTRWMTYWVVFSLFSFAEVFTDILVAFWLPFYYEMKILFILWLTSPYGNGSYILYLHLVRPHLNTYEETIDSYIDCGKQLGYKSVQYFWIKIKDLLNKWMLCFFRMTQTNLFKYIEENAENQRQVQNQSQRLLTQSNPMSYLQHFNFFSGSQQINDNSPQNIQDVMDGRPINWIPPQLQVPQRCFSAEALNLISEQMSSQQRINFRIRSESESNLDDMEITELLTSGSKPPLPTTQTNKPRKRTKNTKSVSSAEKPLRKTRAAALKARAKCKEEVFPEEDNIDTE